MGYWQRALSITAATVTTAITKVTSVGSYATMVYYKGKIVMEKGYKSVSNATS